MNTLTQLILRTGLSKTSNRPYITLDNFRFLFCRKLLPSVTCIFVVLGLFSLQANAAYSSEDTEKPEIKTNTPASEQIESIDPWTGNLLIQHKDLVLPGSDGLNIEVWRTYDLSSASAGLSATHNQSYLWTALGPGWKISAAPTITTESRFGITRNKVWYVEHEFNSFCNGGKLNSGIALKFASGGSERLQSDGNFRALSRSGWRLNCIGNQITLMNPQGIKYDFGTVADKKIGKNYYSGGDQYVFDSMGMPIFLPNRTSAYLVAKSATSPNGNTISFQYQQFGSPIPLWAAPGWYGGPEYVANGEPSMTENPSLLLSSIVSSDGRQVSFTYSKDTGRLEKMSAGDGRVWTYSYLTPDAMNSRSLAKVILPGGDSWLYRYAPGAYSKTEASSQTIPLDSASVAARKLVAITYPTGGSTQYEFGFTNLKLVLPARPSNEVFYVRGERVTRRKLSTGHVWDYTYTRGGAGQYDSTQVSGPEGVTGYKFYGGGFSAANNVWRMGKIAEKTYPDGSSEQYAWQPRELINAPNTLRELGWIQDGKFWAPDLAKKTVTRNGVSYSSEFTNYDLYGNPATKVETGPNGGTRTTAYTYFNDPSKWILGKVASETSPGKSLNRTFDANGNVLTEARDGVTTAFTYDSQGNISSKTLPNGGIYTYSNYKRGIAQTQTRPESVTVTRVVDDAGNITAQTNGEGQTTLYTYDGLNRITSVTPPAGNPRKIVYTPTSKIATRGPLVETTQYDPFGRTASITLAGIARTFTYDGLGRKTFESNPGATNGTSYLYDALGRLTRQTNADGTFQSYSYGPATTSVTDERGNLTSYTYRSYGEPDQQLLMAIATPEASANVTIERSANDLMTAVTQAGLKRTYGYDSHNYLTSVSNPETGVTTYGRDLSGNMISKQVGASGVTQYTYDRLNRLTSTVYPGATPPITNTYNKNSKLLSSNSAGGNRSFAYDAADNLVQDNLALDGRVFTTRFAYDANDSLSSITYPQSSRMVSYSPDALGRPTSISGYISDVKYWPSGLIQSITYNNGIVSRYGQNSRLWPASFITEKPLTATYLNSSYTYDGIGNLATISDNVDASFNRTLGYDGINRLTSVAGFWGPGSIAYDGGGNLINQTLGQASLAYAYDASNRLSSVSGLRTGSFGYDVYGNVKSSLGNTYTYNDVPNLTCINCANPAAKVEYSYDGLNHRSAVTKAAGKAYEIHDSDGKQLIELDGSTLTEYFYLGDKRVAQQVSP